MDTPAVKRGRNWWKVAFFVALIAFEVAREAAVLNRGAVPSAFGTVSHLGSYATATGSWTRTDGGGRLMPSVTRIECNGERGECIEATTDLNDEYVSPPNMDTFAATFAPDAITYQNDIPACALYRVRIDLASEQVIASRVRKANPNKTCANLEPSIKMMLQNSWDTRRDPFEGHFAPLLSFVGWVFHG